MKKLIIFLFTVNIFLNGYSQNGLPAKDLVDSAFLKASKEHKKVMLIFTSTWCSPCKFLRYLMNDPYNKKFFEDNYVITEFFNSEVGDKKILDNPGTTEIRAKYKGNPRYIPYVIILDAAGKILADDIDVPVNKEDIPVFIKILKTTSHLNGMELQMIADRVRQLSYNTEIYE